MGAAQPRPAGAKGINWTPIMIIRGALLGSLYFFSHIVLYSTHGYTGPYFTSKWNLQLDHYGYIYGAMAICTFVGSFVWPAMSDKLQRHMLMLIFTCIGFTASWLMLPLFLIDEVSMWSRVVPMLLLSLAGTFSAGVLPLLDSITVYLSQRIPGLDHKSFGYFRLMAPVGHTAALILVAVINSLVPKIFPDNPEAHEFDGIFLLLGLSTIIFCVLVFFTVPPKTNLTVKRGHHGHGGNKHAAKRAPVRLNSKGEPIGVISQLVHDPGFIVFSIIVFLVSIVRSIGTLFQSIHITTPTTEAHEVTRGIIKTSILVKYARTAFDIRSSGHGTNSSIWISRIGSMFCEIFIFFIGSQAMNFFGVWEWNFIGQTFGILRVAAYYAIDMTSTHGTLLKFLVETLKGINNGAFISSSIANVARFAPDGGLATTQGIFSGIFNGLGTLFSGILGGRIAEYYGTYYLFASAAFLGLIPLFMTFIIIIKEKSENAIARRKRQNLEKIPLDTVVTAESAASTPQHCSAPPTNASNLADGNTPSASQKQSAFAPEPEQFTSSEQIKKTDAPAMSVRSQPDEDE